MSDTLDRMIDQTCDRFEAAWKAGAAPRIEDHLANLEPAARVVALRDLIALDVYYRRKLGEQPSIDEYRARFAELDAASLNSLLQDVAVAGATAQSTVNFPPGETRVSNLKPGQKVSYFGDYELLEEIAHGGMGIVYKARQVSLNRLIALKMIRAGVLASAAEVERFLHEAKLAASLDHPHIVPILESGEHEGQYYYAMKLIEGDSLAQLRDAWCLKPELDRSETRRRQEKIAKLLITTAQAVHHAHQHTIIHRDLKPGNILIDPAGEPHVTDFGLAKKIDGDSAMTQSGAIVGTASYMSPEQANGGKDVTTLTDVYGLGAVMYELLSGRPPFKGQTPLDTLIEVREKEVIWPSKLVSQVDGELVTICLKCLEKDAEKRYGSAEALAEELKRWSAGEPILAVPIGRTERLVRWCKRKPALALTSGTALSAMLVALTTFMVAFFMVDAALDQEHIERIKADNLAKSNMALAETNKDLLQRETKERIEAQRLAKINKDLEFEEKKGRERAERALADVLIMTAQGRLKEGTPYIAADLLGQVPIEHRLTAWHFVKRQLEGSSVTLVGHTKPVVSLAFSPNTETLTSASLDATKLWNIRTGELQHSQGGAYLVAFPPDGSQLVKVDSPNVHFQDVKTGKTERSFRIFGGAGPQPIAISPDCSMFALPHSLFGRVALIHADGAPAKRALMGGALISGNSITAIACGADGSVATGIGDNNRVSPLAGQFPINVWSGSQALPRHLIGHDRSVRCLSFSPDARLLASGSSDVKLWNAKTGALIRTLNADAHSLAFSPDGQWLAAGQWNGSITIWDVASGQVNRQLHGHSGPRGSAVKCLVFSPDGALLASGAEDTSVKLWDIRPRDHVGTFNDKVGTVACRRDGLQLA